MTSTPPKKIAAIVVGALAPLTMAFAVFIANEAQILFHLDLSGSALAGYISVFVGAVVLTGVRVLRHQVHVDLLGFLHRLEANLMPAPPAPPPPPSPASAAFPPERSAPAAAPTPPPTPPSP